MLDRKLKAGWKMWRFDQMAVKVNDRIDDPSQANVDRYVGLEHLDPESLKIRRWGRPSDVAATKLLFCKGDIIFGRRRVYQRKLAVADFDGICSAHAMVLRSQPEVALPEFLPFFMQSDTFMNRALEISVGSLSPTINWKTLAKEEFALPPLEEQRRFAEMLWTIEKYETSLRLTLEGVQIVQRSTAESTMALAITPDSKIDPKHMLPKGWRVEHLANIAHIQFSNVDKKTIQSEIPILLCNYMDVYSRDEINQDIDFMAASATQREIDKFALKKGDVLITKDSETPTDIAVPALVSNNLDNVLCGYHLALIRPIAKLIDSCYLFHAFSLAGSRNYFYRMANGTTRFGLSTDAIKGMPILLPPLVEQIKIVKVLTRCVNSIRYIQRRVSEANELRTNLLNRLSSKTPFEE